MIAGIGSRLGLVLLLAISVGGGHWSGPSLDAWVSFTDKGVLSAEDREAAFRRLERTFDRRALERRRLRRTLPGLFDDHDLPLPSRYLDALTATGAQLRVQSRWLNGVSVLATPEQLEAIQRLPFVGEVRDLHPHVPKGERGGRIPRDPDLRGMPGPGADPSYGWSGEQLRQLGLDRLHGAGYRGAGIRVGVVDTGFRLAHRALAGAEHSLKVVAEWDFMDNDPVASPEPGDSPDQHEHGTLVLGVLAADRPGEMVGSAPDAELILLKAEDGATEYFLEERWFVAALEFAEAHGADIITSSLVLYEGYEGDQVDGRSSVMAQGWRLAVGNGIIGLQGGGNAGHDSVPSTHHLLPPAGVPGVITVGAAGPDGEPTRFSSDGLRVEGTVKPELLARGAGVATVSPYEADAYATSSGTSLATPLLAGGVACLLQAHPDWTVAQVREALFYSGSYFRAHGAHDPLLIRGYGVPDLASAAGIDASASGQGPLTGSGTASGDTRPRGGRPRR